MHQFYSLCSQIIGGIVVCLLIISFSVTLTLNFRKYIWYNKSTKKEGIYYLEGIGETYE